MVMLEQISELEEKLNTPIFQFENHGRRFFRHQVILNLSYKPDSLAEIIDDSFWQIVRSDMPIGVGDNGAWEGADPTQEFGGRKTPTFAEQLASKKIFMIIESLYRTRSIVKAEKFGSPITFRNSQQL